MTINASAFLTALIAACVYIGLCMLIADKRRNDMDAIDYLMQLGCELTGIGLGVSDGNRERKLQYAQECLLKALLKVSEEIWDIRKGNSDEDENGEPL